MDKLTSNNINKIKLILENYGVAIFENYFSDDYADEVFASVKQWLINLQIGLTDNDATWTTANVPLGPRYGMYQSIVSNAPKFWELRQEMYPIFATLLNNDNLITSIDGASIYPAIKTPIKPKDWAHIDQTTSSNFMCYQAQFVATDTDASFVCTPKSHKLHAKILSKFKINTPKQLASNWHKFTDEEVEYLKEKFADNYQIPIIAKKGSVIFWDSRTIHSARYQQSKDDTWRCVFYVSMRPKSTFSPRDLLTVKQAVIDGFTTNHWGTTIFKPFDRYKQKNQQVVNLTKNAKNISYYNRLNQTQRQLIGLERSDVEVIQLYIYTAAKELLLTKIIDKVCFDKIMTDSLKSDTKSYLWKVLANVYQIE